MGKNMVTDGQRGGWKHDWASRQADVAAEQGAGESGNVTKKLRVERQMGWVGD